MEIGSRARALLGVLVVLAFAAFAQPASAAWYKAETDRFVVYGEGKEAAVRDYAVRLQTFDAVLRMMHPSTRDRVTATKVQVFIVRSRADLQQVRPGIPRGMIGLYIPTHEGVFALGLGGDVKLGEDDVMFHEYAHHFMRENFPVAYPAWFTEGFAEYFATAEIKPDGVVVGGYSPARAFSIFHQDWVPMADLLSKDSRDIRPEMRNAYYSQAWLLTHYMRSTPERAARLNKAISDIAGGADPAKAMLEATGMTPLELTYALKGYNKLPRIQVKLPGAAPTVTLSRLPASADDLLLDNLRLILSPVGRADPDLLGDVRRQASKYPGDELAELTLARAEFLLGDVPAGEAIVKRRLDAKADDYETLLLAGTGQILAGLRDGAQRQARFRAARPHLAKAFALNKRDFRPLYAYAFSRSIEPTFPTDNDLNVLVEARNLAPSVGENSLRLGLALLRKGDVVRAKAVLEPVVNNPHGGRLAAQAKALIQGATPAQAEAAGEAAEPETPPEPQGAPPAQPKTQPAAAN
jgi:hypothetical protein